MLIIDQDAISDEVIFEAQVVFYHYGNVAFLRDSASGLLLKYISDAQLGAVTGSTKK